MAKQLTIGRIAGVLHEAQILHDLVPYTNGAGAIAAWAVKLADDTQEGRRLRISLATALTNLTNDCHEIGGCVLMTPKEDA